MPNRREGLVKNTYETAVETGKALKLLRDFAHILKKHEEFDAGDLAVLTAIGERMQKNLTHEDVAALLQISDLMSTLDFSHLKALPPIDPLPTQPKPKKKHMVSVAGNIIRHLQPTTNDMKALNNRQAQILAIAGRWSVEAIKQMASAIAKNGAKAVLLELQKQQEQIGIEEIE